MERTNAHWRIRLLGRIEVSGPGQEILRFQTRKTGGLLAYLAYHRGQLLSRDRLIEQIWPELPVENGRACLSTALTSLRRQLEPRGLPRGAMFAASQEGIRLHKDSVVTDVWQFTAAARAAVLAAEEDEALRRMLLAIDLYGGDLLPDADQEWVSVERERLAMILARTVHQAVRTLEKREAREQALEVAMRAAAAAPDREEIHYEVIRLYRSLGHDPEAGQYYRMVERRLLERWDSRPSAPTIKLVEGLQLPGAKSRLRRRAISAPEPPAHVPPIPQVKPVAPAAMPSVRPGGFFGRQKELARILEALQPRDSRAPGAVRLVTLTGAPGVGKTRLGLEAASCLRDSYAGRTVMVPLAEAHEPEDVDRTILASLGARPDAHTPVIEALRSTLAGEPFLLLLDNAEHVRTHCADLLEELLDKVPNLACIVTSRIPLGIEGERTCPVAPLPVPERPTSAGVLLDFASVQLFVSRTQEVSPDFQVTERNAAAVGTLCQRLEGIPLAIELAAARARVLTPLCMLSELDARFQFLKRPGRRCIPRHRTLEAAVEWSWQLLMPSQQDLLERLSVFRGGFTLDAARAVDTGKDTLDDLQSLIESSLIYVEKREAKYRYRMLESLREFAGGRLGPSDLADATRRHTRFYSELAVHSAPKLRTASAPDALEDLEADHPNLRAAIRNSETSQDALEMASSLWRFWFARGHAAWGAKCLEDLLARNPDAPPDVCARGLIATAALRYSLADYARGRSVAADAVCQARQTLDDAVLAEALNIQGVLALEAGDLDAARGSAYESLQLYRGLGDEWGSAAALNNLGRISHGDSDLEQARASYVQSEAIYNALGDSCRAAVALSNLGVICLEQRDYAAARIYCERCLTLAHRAGDLAVKSVALYNMAEALYRDGSHPAARALAEESIRLRRQIDDVAGIAYPLSTLAYIAAAEGDRARACRLYGVAESLRSRFGLALSAASARQLKDELIVLRQMTRHTDFDRWWASGAAMPIEEALKLALEEAVPGAPNPDALLRMLIPAHSDNLQPSPA